MMNWLREHCLQRRAEITERRARVSESELYARIADQAPARPFLQALHRSDRIAVIAEIKFRSPSEGPIRPACDVEHVAASYEANGASALSVLIDEVHFGGSREFLTRARQTTQLPALAKGFLVDPYDVLEARSYGADAVLLIASCLERTELETMHTLAQELGMAALVELHSEADFHKVQGLELPLVGVNHRNLDTLQMDMELSARLGPQLPADSLRVAESGICSHADLEHMKALGYHAVLVGTRFMKYPEPGQELAKLLTQPMRTEAQG
jgi:indole-3-glycerol phosphate synthase